MGWITDWTMNNADEFLTGVGALGGFVVGLTILDVWGACVTAVVGALLTAFIADEKRIDPPLGPQQ